MSGPIPAGSPRVNARGCIKRRELRSAMFDHRTGTQLLQIALALLGETILQDLLARLALSRQLAGGRALAAQGEQLDALLLALRRGERAFRRLVEDLAQAGREVAGGADDRLPHRDITHAAGHPDALVAVLEAAAQGFGLLGARRERLVRGVPRHDQQDRAQHVFVADRRLVVLAGGIQRVEDVALADLELGLEPPADDLRPAEVGPDAGLDG